MLARFQVSNRLKWSSQRAAQEHEGCDVTVYARFGARCATEHTAENANTIAEEAKEPGSRWILGSNERSPTISWG